MSGHASGCCGTLDLRLWDFLLLALLCDHLYPFANHLLRRRLGSTLANHGTQVVYRFAQFRGDIVIRLALPEHIINQLQDLAEVSKPRSDRI